MTADGLLAAVRGDLATAAGAGGTAATWAKTIYASSPNGLAIGQTTTDVSLDALQSALLLDQEFGTAAQMAYSQGAHRPSSGSVTQPLAAGSTCNPAETIQSELTQALKGSWGIAMNRLYGYALKKTTYTGLKFSLALMEALGPIINLLLVKLAFRSEIALHPDPINRTPQQGVYGKRALSLAGFWLDLPSGSAAECLALWVYLTGSSLDVQLPPQVPLKGLDVNWILRDNYDEASHNFVEFAAAAQGGDTRTVTDNGGYAKVVLTGSPQQIDKTKFTQRVPRQAQIGVQLDPTSASKFGDSVMTALIDAAWTALNTIYSPVKVVIKADIA